MNNASRCERYREYFTKDFLMGPNSFRLLDELVEENTKGLCFGRTLDLGCGMALTSVFLAKETNADAVYAFDLWIDAGDNFKRIDAMGLADKIIPIHGDALDMPFAREYFDTVVSVDAYHYFGTQKGVFSEKILPFVKKGGRVLIAVPGLREKPTGEMEKLFKEWASDGDDETFKTVSWWKALLQTECGDTCDISVTQSGCCDIAWQDWYATGHEYAMRDKEYLDRGLYDFMNFVCMRVTKR